MKHSGKDTHPDQAQPGAGAAARQPHDSHQKRLRRAAVDTNEQATANARQAEQEVHKGVGLAQQTARNNDRMTHRHLTSSERNTSNPNRTHKEK